MLGRVVVAVHEGEYFDYSCVVKQQVGDELGSSHAQLSIFIVDAVEEPAHFLGVEALVDCLLVSRIFLDEPAYAEMYCVRLRIRAMNLATLLSSPSINLLSPCKSSHNHPHIITTRQQNE